MKNTYTISFKIDKNTFPTTKDLKSIDIWLKDVLLLEKSENTLNQSFNEEVLNRIFRLYNKFLYLLKIPIFNQPKCLSVIENDKYIEIKILLYYLEYLPQTFFNTIFSLSFKYISNDFLRNNSKQNIFDFYKKIDDEIIKPYQKYSGASKSSIPILKTATKMNIPILNLSRGIFQLGWGHNSTMLIGTSVDNDSKIGSQIVGNKMLTAILLKKAALPYPIHKLVFKEEECLEAIKKLSFPVVIKPCDENEGRGVTINVKDEKKLIQAFNIAKKASSSGQILVEKQVKGQCHRIFIVNQKILYVVKRDPKSIKADGLSTIKELIIKANEHNELLPIWEKSEPFPLDEETIEVISKLGFNLDSKPKKDQWIPLRYIESSLYGGRNIDLTDKIHPENIHIALKAARLFGMEVAGVDIISEDISIPWYENGAIINEVNFSPQLGRDEFTKDKIPIYLNSIIKNNGRIPIWIVLGKEKALKKALQLQKKISNSFVTSDKSTYSSTNTQLYYSSNDLNKRINSLFLDKEVEHIIVVIQKDEQIEALKIDKIDELIIIEEDKNYFTKKNITFLESLLNTN